MTVQYPCVICEGEVREVDPAVECEVCSQWTHIMCDGTISIARYSLSVSDELPLNFLCRTCIYNNTRKIAK